MKRKTKIFLGLHIFITCIWTFLVITNLIEPIDTIVYESLMKFRTNNLTSIVKVITQVGGPLVLITLAVLSLFSKDKKYPKLIISNLVLSFGINQILKRVIRRSRPNILRLTTESGFSYPSGHSMVSICFYGLIIYLLYKSNIKYKKIYISILSIFILVIGISRIYLGVHYFSDIIGGYLFGLLYLFIFINCSNKLLKK